MPRVIFIGRNASCDVSVSDDTVSWRHAKVTFLDGGAVEISDLKSTNGTFIMRNGAKARIQTATVLLHEHVWLGEYEFIVNDLLRQVAAPSPVPLPAMAAVPVAPIRPAPAERRERVVRCEHCGAVRAVSAHCPECLRR